MNQQHKSPHRLFAFDKIWGAILPAVLAGTLAAGCTSSSSEPAAPPPGAHTAEMKQLSPGSFTPNWRSELPLQGSHLKQLFVNNDRVFAYGSDNRCFWLNRDSGHVASVEAVARSSDHLFEPVTLGDQVIFPSTNQLAIYDAKTTKRIHTTSLRRPASGPAVGDSQTIYIGLDYPGSGRLAAVELLMLAYDISPRWELMTSGKISAKPAVYQGGVFVGSRDGGVYAVRTDNREALWPGLPDGYFKTALPIVADVQADISGVYVASLDSKLYCLDLNTGRVKWTYYAGRPLREESGPVLTDSLVYVYVPDVGLAAVDKTATAEIRSARWVVPNGRQYLASDDRYAYLRTIENTLVAVDKQTGEIKFSSRHSQFSVFATNTKEKDNTIYAGTPGGLVYSIRPIFTGGTVGELVLDVRPQTLAAAK